jgi:hypothetical protein
MINHFRALPDEAPKSGAFAATPEDAIGPNVSFQFEKASPFRPRIARTMSHLSQCDAIATG